MDWKIAHWVDKMFTVSKHQYGTKFYLSSKIPDPTKEHYQIVRIVGITQHEKSLRIATYLTGKRWRVRRKRGCFTDAQIIDIMNNLHYKLTKGII